MDAVRRLVERDRVVGAGGEVDDAQLQAAGDALGDGEVAGEDVDVVEHDAGARRDQLLGRRQVGRFGIDRHEAEVAPGVVDADVEAAGAVLEVVLDVGAAGEHGAHRKGLVGAEVGVGDFPLGRVLALAAEKQVALVERLADADVEQLVGLLVQQLVRADGTDGVAPQAIGALGRVHRHVVERAAVVRPRRRRDLLDRPGIDDAGDEVLDVERVVAAAGEVGRVGEPVRVARDGSEAEAKERLAARELVQVEQRLVDAGRVVAPVRTDGAPAQVVRVLLAAPRPGRVPPVALSHRHRIVVLLDAREHLLVELLLQLGVRRQPGVGVGVLGLQVGERARIVAVAQPEVVVAARVAVNADVARFARRDRRCGRRHGRRGRRQRTRPRVGRGPARRHGAAASHARAGHRGGSSAALRSPIGASPLAASARSRSSTPGSGARFQRRVMKRRIEPVS